MPTPNAHGCSRSRLTSPPVLLSAGASLLARRAALACALAWTPQVILPVSAKPLEPCSGAVSHISELTVGIVLPAGVLPQDVAAQCAATSPRTEDRRRIGPWAMTEYHWMASCMRHRPLYFEEIGLERYGHATCRGLQPLVSAAKFFANAAAIPYKMALEHPRSCIYALGHPRPGNRTPRVCWRPPLRFRAGLVEAGAVVGLIFLIP